MTSLQETNVEGGTLRTLIVNDNEIVLGWKPDANIVFSNTIWNNEEDNEIELLKDYSDILH